MDNWESKRPLLRIAWLHATYHLLQESKNPMELQFQTCFIFTPIPGEMIQFDYSIFFQMGGKKPPTS